MLQISNEFDNYVNQLILESPNSAKPKSAAITVNVNKRVRKPSWKSLSFEESGHQGAHLAQSPPPTNPWKTLPPPEQPAQLQNILQVIFDLFID